MTANQVAAEGNRIQAEVAKNQLAETERHNREIEDYNSKIADYQRIKVGIDESVAATEREYKDWYKRYEETRLQWEMSQGQRKLDLETKLADLQAQQVSIEENYKSAMAHYYQEKEDYDKMIAQAETDKVKLQSDFQEFQKTKAWAEFGLHERDLAIKSKQLEYDYSLRHEQNLITQNFNTAQMDYRWAQLNFEREQMNRSLRNALDLGYITYNARMAELGFAKEKYEFEKKLTTSQSFQNYASGLFGKSGIIPGTLDVAKTFIPFGVVGGINGPKTAKQIAESLFK